MEALMTVHKALWSSFLSLATLATSAFVADGVANAKPTDQVVRGWLSDEQCARGRAQGGRYTVTNGECAKECVKTGKRIVMIDPDGKRVLDIANQDAVAHNIGDYVEITGTVDGQGKSMRVDSLKFLDTNRAVCEVPAKKSAAKKSQSPPKIPGPSIP
jgi:hypothetical protein